MVDRERDLCTEVLGFLQEYLQLNGYAPTYEEIREAVGLSSRSHAAYYLDALEKRGLVVRTPRSPRGLRLVDAPLMLRLGSGGGRRVHDQEYAVPSRRNP
ncbi:MAG: LexA family protein [Anaerolineae bacterium]